MVDIKFIVTTEKFTKDVKKIKDRGLKEAEVLCSRPRKRIPRPVKGLLNTY